MGENQIDAAGVDVDRRRAEQTQRHGGALDVPARATRTNPWIPGRLPFLGRFPQHEIAGVFLVVLVRIDACATLDAGMVEMRELAVVRKRRDLEVDRAVAPVGMSVLLERLDRVGHRGEILGISGARILFHRLEPECRRVLPEEIDVAIGVFAQRHACLLGLEDRPIVNVGEVHHLAYGIARLVCERAAEDVERDEGSEVADVPARVHRQAARVHPHGIVVCGREVLLAAGQRVVQTHQSHG